MTRDEATEASDLDLFLGYDSSRPFGLFDVLFAQYLIADELLVPVDILTRSSLHPVSGRRRSETRSGSSDDPARCRSLGRSARAARIIEDLVADERPHGRIDMLALERALEILSEASRHGPAALKVEYPTTPWQKIADLGNTLRHG